MMYYTMQNQKIKYYKKHYKIYCRNMLKIVIKNIAIELMNTIKGILQKAMQYDNIKIGQNIKNALNM